MMVPTEPETALAGSIAPALLPSWSPSASTAALTVAALLICAGGVYCVDVLLPIAILMVILRLLNYTSKLVAAIFRKSLLTGSLTKIFRCLARICNYDAGMKTHLLNHRELKKPKV